MTEQRAVATERETMDRFTVAAAERAGDVTRTGRVTGVIRAGVFVTLEGVNADGFVPKRLLPRDSYDFDAAHHSLKGRRSKRRYRLGDAMEVRIKEADPMAGRLLLEPVSGGLSEAPKKPPKRAKKGKKSRKNRG